MLMLDLGRKDVVEVERRREGQKEALVAVANVRESRKMGGIGSRQM